MDVAAFAAWVLGRHPDLDPGWVEDELTTTFVASLLAGALQAPIDAGDRRAVAFAYETFRTAFLDGDAGVRSSLIVSGLSRVNLDDSKKAARSWARELMPEVLRINLEDYEAYVEELLSRPRPTA